MSDSNQQATNVPLQTSDELSMSLEDLAAANSEENVETSDDKPKEKARQSQTDGNDDQNEDTENKDEQPKKRKNGFQRRIERFNNRIQQLEAALEQATRGNQQSQQAQQQSSQNDDGPKRPSITDFESLEEYEEAIEKYTEEKAALKLSRTQQSTQASQSAQAAASDWDKRAAEVSKSIPEYASVVTPDAVQDLQPDPLALRFLFKQADGPAILFDLLSNDDLASDFAEGDAEDQLEILAQLKLERKNSGGRRTASLEQYDDDEDAPQSRRISQASAPKGTPRGKNAGSFAVINDKMSIDELDRALSQMDQRRRRR